VGKGTGKIRLSANVSERMIFTFFLILAFFVGVFVYLHLIRLYIPSNYESYYISTSTTASLLYFIIVCGSEACAYVEEKCIQEKKWEWRYRSFLRIVNLDIFSFVFLFVYWGLPHESWGTVLSGEANGVVSLNETYFIGVLLALLVPVQLGLSCFKRLWATIRQAMIGSFALGALLLPNIMDSYNLAQAHLSGQSNVEYVYVVESINILFAVLAASIALNSVLASVMPFAREVWEGAGIDRPLS
jgi:membrane protein